VAHPVWWERVEVRVVHSLGLLEHGALVPRVDMVHQTQDDTGDARRAAAVAQLPAAAGEPQHRIDHAGPRQAYLHAHARLLSALRYRSQDSAAVIHPAVRVPPPLTGSGWWVRSAPVQDQATAVPLVKKMGQQPLSTPVHQNVQARNTGHGIRARQGKRTHSMRASLAGAGRTCALRCATVQDCGISSCRSATLCAPCANLTLTAVSSPCIPALTSRPAS